MSQPHSLPFTSQKRGQGSCGLSDQKLLCTSHLPRPGPHVFLPQAEPRGALGAHPNSSVIPQKGMTTCARHRCVFFSPHGSFICLGNRGPKTISVFLLASTKRGFPTGKRTETQVLVVVFEPQEVPSGVSKPSRTSVVLPWLPVETTPANVSRKEQGMFQAFPSDNRQLLNCFPTLAGELTAKQQLSRQHGQPRNRTPLQQQPCTKCQKGTPQLQAILPQLTTAHLDFNHSVRCILLHK